MDLFLITFTVLLISFTVLLGSIRRSENRRRRAVTFKTRFGTNPPLKGASLREKYLLREKARKEIRDLFERTSSVRKEIEETTDVEDVRRLSKMAERMDGEAITLFALLRHFGVAGKKESIWDFLKPED